MQYGRDVLEKFGHTLWKVSIVCPTLNMDSVCVEKEAIEKMEGCGDLHKTIKLVPSDAEERKRQVILGVLTHTFVESVMDFVFQRRFDHYMRFNVGFHFICHSPEI